MWRVELSNFSPQNPFHTLPKLVAVVSNTGEVPELSYPNKLQVVPRWLLLRKHGTLGLHCVCEWQIFRRDGERLLFLCGWEVPGRDHPNQLQDVPCRVLLSHIGAFDLLLVRLWQIHGIWSEWVHLL
jgi:hypothetical protein